MNSINQSFMFHYFATYWAGNSPTSVCMIRYIDPICFILKLKTDLFKNQLMNCSLIKHRSLKIIFILKNLSRSYIEDIWVKCFWCQPSSRIISWTVSASHVTVVTVCTILVPHMHWTVCIRYVTYMHWTVCIGHITQV